MADILNLYEYPKFTEVIQSVDGQNVSVLIDSPTRSYITSLIFNGNEIIDYKTTNSSVVGEITLTFTIPDKYNTQNISVYSFSHPDGYSNRLIGSSYWAVWFDHISPPLSVNNDIQINIKGAVFLVVPWKSGTFNLKFSRLGDSAAAHGELL